MACCQVVVFEAHCGSDGRRFLSTPWQIITSLGMLAGPDQPREEGPRSGDRRVLRGGNWTSTGGKNCRSARRGKDDPTAATPFDGFRVVMVPA